jgi:hypothetical protein
LIIPLLLLILRQKFVQLSPLIEIDLNLRLILQKMLHLIILHSIRLLRIIIVNPTLRLGRSILLQKTHAFLELREAIIGKLMLEL